LGGYLGRLGESAATLLAGLRLEDEITEAVDKVVVYALLRRSEDATNTRATELSDRAYGLIARAQAAASFVEPEVAALAEATLAVWYAAEPGLERYRTRIERIQRRRSHIRSVEVEEFLAANGATPIRYHVTSLVLGGLAALGLAVALGSPALSIIATAGVPYSVRSSVCRRRKRWRSCSKVTPMPPWSCTQSWISSVACGPIHALAALTSSAASSAPAATARAAPLATA